jgi:hypothetical protein
MCTKYVYLIDILVPRRPVVEEESDVVKERWLLSSGSFSMEVARAA